MPKNIATILLLLFSLTTLSACDLGDLRLTVQFNRVNGLEPGARIIHRQKYIGDVERITRSDQGFYLVELDIDSDHKNQLTVYSLFYIDPDPDRAGRKAVFTEQKKPGGILLTDHSVVAGADSPPYLRKMLAALQRQAETLSSRLAEQIDRAQVIYREKSPEVVQGLESLLAEIESQMEALEKALRTAPDSDAVRELQRNLDNLVAELEAALEQGGPDEQP